MNGAAFDARRVDARVRLAMRVLEFEQTRVPGIGELAARVGLSPFHLSRMFAAQVGETCAAYSRRIRLDNANNQLLHDVAPLGIVAATFGYASQAAFTRAYTRQFGMSPMRYVTAILGRTPADHAASHLEPVGATGPAGPLLPGRVGVAERPSRAAFARRFYGHDLQSHWRTFLADLPWPPDANIRFAGAAYDNARVTPPAWWRYDCAAVFPAAAAPLPVVEDRHGLDVVELPGGVHAEVASTGGFDDLRRATVGLLTEWLPLHREYEPEGDPAVHWFEAAPDPTGLSAVATIRVRLRGSAPAYNMPPLTRHGRPAGHRTDPSSI